MGYVEKTDGFGKIRRWGRLSKVLDRQQTLTGHVLYGDRLKSENNGEC